MYLLLNKSKLNELLTIRGRSAQRIYRGTIFSVPLATQGLILLPMVKSSSSYESMAEFMSRYESLISETGDRVLLVKAYATDERLHFQILSLSGAGSLMTDTGETPQPRLQLLSPNQAAAMGFNEVAVRVLTERNMVRVDNFDGLGGRIPMEELASEASIVALKELLTHNRMAVRSHARAILDYLGQETSNDSSN